MAIGDQVGEKAAEQLDKTVHTGLDQVAHEVIPDLQQATAAIVQQFASSVVMQFTGALTQAVGALCVSLGSVPESIVTALDGVTIKVSPIEVTIQRYPQATLHVDGVTAESKPVRKPSR